MATETPVALPEEGLLKWLLERLPRPSDKEGLARVSKATGVNEHTLLKIVKGETEDPRVGTIELLVQWALDEAERAAA